jgi:cell division protein FtsW
MRPESKTLLVLVFILLGFGLLVLSSAGIVESQRKFDSSYYYLFRQLQNGLLPGLILFLLFSRIDYRKWKKLSLFVMIFAVFLLTMVLMPATGYGLRGATRWLSFGFLPSFQPSELAKLALVLYLAAFFSTRGERAKDLQQGLIPFSIIMIFVGILLLLQPDTGTFITMALISFAIYFFAGARMKHIVAVVLISFIILFTLALLTPYRLDRIRAFVNPTEDVQGVAYQLTQSHIAIGSGGITGVGFGKSIQKFRYLPEPTSDSIFAILTEELGLIGAYAVLGLLFALILTLVKISKKTTDRFGRLFVLGVAVWIFVQTAINVGGLVGLLPLTGLPLLFFSAGGTSLAVMLAALGIVFNVSEKA